MLAGAAYLNAKWYISYDAHFVGSIFKSLFYVSRLDRVDRNNAYYAIETHALNPKTADKHCLVFAGRELSH